MKSDAFFFIGIFLFIFVVWVASGGPSRPISFSGPYLKPITDTGTRAEAYGVLPEIKLGSAERSVSGSVGGIRDSLSELRDQVEELQELGEPSPYRDMVTIQHSTSGVRSNFAAREYITLSVGNKAKEPINISGWRLVSGASGSYGTIPNGTSVATAGSVNLAEAIMVSKGDKVIVNSGRAPTGISFKENVCTGYFEEYQDFHPSLQLSCPTPEKDFDEFYPGNPQSEGGDECLEYIEDTNFDRCEMATSTPRGVSSACKTYLTKYINYNGCVLMHGADENFTSRTWRVFLGAKGHLWKDDRETIRLLDREGRVVDVFAY
jgi:hypothetical protein